MSRKVPVSLAALLISTTELVGCHDAQDHFPPAPCNLIDAGRDAGRDAAVVCPGSTTIVIGGNGGPGTTGPGPNNGAGGDTTTPTGAGGNGAGGDVGFGAGGTTVTGSGGTLGGTGIGGSLTPGLGGIGP